MSLRHRSSGVLCAVVLVLGIAAAGPGPWSARPAAAAQTVKAVSLQVGATPARATVTWFARSTSGQRVEYGVATPAGRLPAAPVRRKAAARPASERGWSSVHAAMTGLRPGTTYAYRVGSHRSGWSSVSRFTTPAGEYGTFLAFGDPQLTRSGRTVNGAAGWARTLDTALRRHPRPRFVFSLGDQVNDPAASAEWDAFFAPPALRGQRLATLIGNHDQARRAPQYGQHVVAPNLVSTGRAPGTGNAYFVEGKTLVIALDSNEKRLAVHRDYLRKVIAANPRVTWRIVGFHHSPFSGSSHADDADVRAFRAGLTPEFGRQGIDLVLGGHDHSYVRTHLMNGPRISRRGSANPTVHRPRRGETLYLTLNSSSGSKMYPLVSGTPWAAKRDQGRRPTYTAVTTSATRLTASTYHDRGRRVDEVTLTR